MNRFIILCAVLALSLAACSQNNLIKEIKIKFDNELDAQVDTKIPVSLPVEGEAKANIKKEVSVEVPIRETFEIPLKEDIEVRLNEPISLPIDQDITINAVIPVDIIVPIDTIVTTTVAIPLIGNVELSIPIQANVPVRVNVPIENQKVRVKDMLSVLLSQKLKASVDDTIEAHVDTRLKTTAEIDDVFYVPVMMSVDSLVPISQKIPVRINQTLSIKQGDITLVR